MRLLKLSFPAIGDVFTATHFVGVEYLSRLSNYRIIVFSEESDIKLKSLLYKTATLSLRNINEQGGERYFNGIVSSATKKNNFILNKKECTEYEIILKPSLFALTKRKNSRVFRQKDIFEIINEVISDCKVIKGGSVIQYEFKKSDKHPVRDYCVQQNETDFNFISRLLESEGVYYYFKQTQSSDIVVFSDSKAGYQAHKTPAIFRQRNLRDCQITCWQANWQAISGKFKLTDYNFEQPDAYQDTLLKEQLVENYADIVIPETMAELEQFHYPGGYENSSDGDSIATWRAEAEQSKFNKYNGESNYASFMPGIDFELQSDEDHSVKGNYVIEAIYHEAYDLSHYHGANKQSEKSQHYKNRFTSMVNDINYRPQLNTVKPLVSGTQSAQVTGPDGNEIYTDQYRRISVQFFWDRYGVHDENSSCMMRVSQAWAGKKFGLLFTPRVGHEVLAHFIDGDIDRPYISGSTYNAEHMPPYDHNEGRTKNGIVTRTTTDGSSEQANELQFDDAKQKELIYLQAQKDYKCLVKHNHDTTVHQNSESEIVGSRKTTIKEGNEAILLEKGNHNMDVAGEGLMSAQMIKIAVGENYVQLDTGGVTIKGIKININP